MFDAEEPAETWPFFVVSLKLRMGGGTVDRRDCWQLLRSATRRWSWWRAGHSSFSYPTCPAWPWKVLEVFTLAIWWSVNKVQFAALPPVVLSAWCASKAPTCPRLVRRGDTAGYLCLKRPSFFCLIHFYKRCVSSLTLMGRSPWVRSGWVSVLSVTTFFIQG